MAYKQILSSPHFSGTTVTDCFKWKNYLDSELESDFKKLNSEPPQRLSFNLIPNNLQ